LSNIDRFQKMAKILLEMRGEFAANVVVNGEMHNPTHRFSLDADAPYRR